MDEKPQITKKEVSWYQVTAAVRARRAAEALGIDPAARLAMIHAGAAASADRPPIVLATLWAMEETDARLADLCGGDRYADQALLALTLMDPERVLVSLLAGDLDDVRQGIVETAATLSPERATALESWFAEEMRRLKQLAGGSAEDASLKK